MSEQDILKTELRWAAIAVAAVALIVAVIVISSVTRMLQPPSHIETIDPAGLHVSGEFIESNLGTTQNPDGSVTVRVIATQFAFVPHCLAVPVQQAVTLRVTSPDVIHGFLVAGTNVNTMVVPGYISQVHTVFRNAGNYLMPCHEFCGLGHSEMWSIVHVLSRSEWHPDVNGRVSCETRR